MGEPHNGYEEVFQKMFTRRSSGRESNLAKFVMPSEKLRELELFKGCDYDFVSKVIIDVDCRIYSPGDIIIQEGDKADSCYILLSGDVSVLSKGVKVAKLSGGSIFGETCLLGIAEFRTASVVADDVCDVRVVHKKEFNLALKSFPKERERFVKEAERRMAEIIKKNPEAAPPPKEPARRIAPVLLKLQQKGIDLGLEDRVERVAPKGAFSHRRTVVGSPEVRSPEVRSPEVPSLAPFASRRRRQSTGSHTRSFAVSAWDQLKPRRFSTSAVPNTNRLDLPQLDLPQLASTGSRYQNALNRPYSQEAVASSKVSTCPVLPVTPKQAATKVRSSSADSNLSSHSSNFGDVDVPTEWMQKELKAK